METDPKQSTQTMEGLRNQVFAKAAIGLIALTGATSEALAFGAQPVSAEGQISAAHHRRIGLADNVPVHQTRVYLADTALNPALEQECVQAGLILPTNLYAKMWHPGQKPYANNPRQVGPIQTTGAGGRYSAMPAECADGYRRNGRVKVEIEVHKDKWRGLEERFWSRIYSRNIEGNGGISLTPTGHEHDWYYWKPGEKVRAKFDNVVKNLQTGETVTSKTEIIPVKVYSHKN